MKVKGAGPANRRVIVVLPHQLVGSACVAELLVAALLGDPAVVEHHDLVDLVKPVAFVGDEQDGAALGGMQQVRGERPAGSTRLTRSWSSTTAGSPNKAATTSSATPADPTSECGRTTMTLR